MKLSPRMVLDINCLIYHSKSDMSYGSGGSFVTSDGLDNLDQKQVKSVERAIKFLTKILKERN